MEKDLFVEYCNLVVECCDALDNVESFDHVSNLAEDDRYDYIQALEEEVAAHKKLIDYVMEHHVVLKQKLCTIVTETDDEIS